MVILLRIMEISKNRINKYAMLRLKKYRDREGLFLVQGRKAVDDTLPYFELEAMIENEPDIRKITTLENVPDVIAVYRIPQTRRNLEVESDRFTLVLDGVQDPGNMGTIIRTAHWFGVKRIFCSPDTVDVYNPKVVLSTMGSIAKVDVTYCSLTELFDSNPGLPIYGMLLEGRNIFETDNLRPGFIVMGNEGHGPKESTRSRITEGLTIPAANPGDAPDSLNVAIATAITLSQLLK